MKPSSVEMACLLGIQNEIQAVWLPYSLGDCCSFLFRNEWRSFWVGEAVTVDCFSNLSRLDLGLKQRLWFLLGLMRDNFTHGFRPLSISIFSCSLLIVSFLWTIFKWISYTIFLLNWSLHCLQNKSFKITFGIILKENLFLLPITSVGNSYVRRQGLCTKNMNNAKRARDEGSRLLNQHKLCSIIFLEL